MLEKIHFLGEKPEKYEFKDVPLLDDNFLNETHVKSGDTILQAGVYQNIKYKSKFYFSLFLRFQILIFYFRFPPVN